jgi:hypothetical protein
MVIKPRNLEEMHEMLDANEIAFISIEMGSASCMEAGFEVVFYDKLIDYRYCCEIVTYLNVKSAFNGDTTNYNVYQFLYGLINE